MHILKNDNLPHSFFYTQLRGYATFQSVTLEIDGTYQGMAVNGDEKKEIECSDFYAGICPGILPAVHIVPFVVFLVTIVASLIGLSVVRIKSFLKIIRGYPILQANLLACLLFCSLATLFITIIDIISLYHERHVSLPSYYPDEPQAIHNITIPFLIIYSIMFSTGTIWFCVEVTILQVFNSTSDIVFKFCSFDTGKRLAMSAILIVGSLCLAVSYHIPNIIMAWATDPFYSSRIFLYYGVIFFVYFSTFQAVYIMSYKVLARKITSRLYLFLITVTFLFISLLLSTGILITMTIFVVNAPVNHSIEAAAGGVDTVYNSMVVIVGALIAYRIGWHYLGYSFSIEKALEIAMKEMKATPFHPDNSTKWATMNREGRLSEVMKALIYRHTTRGPPYLLGCDVKLPKMAVNGDEVDGPTTQSMELFSLNIPDDSDVLMRLAELIPKGRLFARRELRLKDSDISEIMADYPDSIQEQNYEMLLRWKQSQSEGVTYNTLGQAVRRAFGEQLYLHYVKLVSDMQKPTLNNDKAHNTEL